MLVLRERIIGVPVMSLQTGAEIARTESAIIDPRYLRIHAFYCNGPQLDTKPAVLHIEDIREVSSLGFIVDGADDLMPPDDLVRLKEIVDFKFKLEDKPVVDDTGRKIGKVSNYSVDSNTFHITQLSVTPNFWQSIGTTEVLIHRSQIVEITDSKIVVKSPSVKADDAVTSKPRPVIDNPFRRPHPQPQPDATATEPR